jgi:hypothetical protein
MRQPLVAGEIVEVVCSHFGAGGMEVVVEEKKMDGRLLLQPIITTTASSFHITVSYPPNPSFDQSRRRHTGWYGSQHLIQSLDSTATEKGESISSKYPIG